MKPYYEHAGITIYHGDCREVLTGLLLPASCVSVTDPPYNVGINYGAATDDSRIDYEGWCNDWFSKLENSCAVIGLTPGIVNVHMWCKLRMPLWIIAWHKPAAMGRSPFGFCNWEPVLVFGKSRKQTSVDVITAPIIPSGDVDAHPCPKPLAWAKGLINTLSLDSDTILDPFMGSGTTLRAAKDLGRRAIGIEIEERYCEIAARRLEQSILPFGSDETDVPIATQKSLLTGERP